MIIWQIKGSTPVYDAFGTILGHPCRWSAKREDADRERTAMLRAYPELVEATITEVDMVFGQPNTVDRLNKTHDYE